MFSKIVSNLLVWLAFQPFFNTKRVKRMYYYKGVKVCVTQALTVSSNHILQNLGFIFSSLWNLWMSKQFCYTVGQYYTMQNDMLDLSSGNDNTQNINYLVVSNGCLNSARGDNHSQNAMCVHSTQCNNECNIPTDDNTEHLFVFCSKVNWFIWTFLFFQFRSPHATFIIILTADYSHSPRRTRYLSVFYRGCNVCQLFLAVRNLEFFCT